MTARYDLEEPPPIAVVEEPSVDGGGGDDDGLTAPCAPHHATYVLCELIKNALVATVERHLAENDGFIDEA